jgi:hypothetical protein
VFFVGAALTVGLGGLTIASAVDTSQKHDGFAAGKCDQFGSPACDTAASNGTNAQTRTNVLIAATAVVGLATIVIGAAFTRWSNPAPRAARAKGWYLEF